LTVQLTDTWAEDRQHVSAKRMDGFAQLGGIKCGYEPAPGTYEQRIARRRPKPRQRPAHGGRTQAKASSGPRHATFGKQCVRRQKKVQVQVIHS